MFAMKRIRFVRVLGEGEELWLCCVGFILLCSLCVSCVFVLQKRQLRVLFYLKVFFDLI